MKNKVIIWIADRERIEVNQGETLLTISRQYQERFPTSIVAAKVNHEIKDLHAGIDEDSTIQFLDLTTTEGMRVYQRSLAFVLVVAVRELYPDGEVTIEHSLSKGIYCEVYIDRELTSDDMQTIEGRMHKIVEDDRPFIKRRVTKQEAMDMFQADGQPEKVRLLGQMQRDTVSIYYCGDVYDYFYGTLAPSTGSLQLFSLAFCKPGLILRFPEKEKPDELPPLLEQPKLAQIFREAEEWGKALHCGYVGALNQAVATNQIDEIIRIAEALHEKKLANIADYITENRDKVRVILVAGPSSSGKTTFVQRLNVQLRVNGVRPLSISLDDYFLDRVLTPRDEQGNYDFESIEALDLGLFNEHLVRLLQGETVKIPTYNFLIGQREYRGHTLQLEPDQPVIIEGIHGLNERLTLEVPREQKIKIYVSAITQLSIDNHNRIPTTDTRLIRRIVRDSQFRAHDALQTLELWPSVRRGEERNIFPFQEEADIMFNSALIYELGILKPYAEALLNEVGQDKPEYAEAQRLLNFLAYFHDIDGEIVPSNSILREFLGKSCFYKD
ncbi:MAG: udk [Firmicutes bacterium]|nr:udk [Bacillota bacterium]